MAEILILGAGLNGLSTALLLAGDGHDVTVLERDPAEPADLGGDSDKLWNLWERRGVNQFRLPHYMLPRWRTLMESELRPVIDQLTRMGGLRTNLMSTMPTALSGGWRGGDEQFDTVTGRRPVVEAAVASVATSTAGVTVRRGVTVTGLVVGSSAVPRVPNVTGVLTDEGTAIRADLVVDATGRRSPIGSMLEAVGGRRPLEEREDSGFAYYARHFRSSDGSLPEHAATTLEHFDSLSIITLPSDNGSWSVVFTTSARDRQLRGLRDPDVWQAALAVYPTAADWGTGEPLTDVQPMAAIEDRYCRYVVDGTPVATGLVAVGDAWACTNPSLGRGTSIGLLHAIELRNLLREIGPDEPEKLVRCFDEGTEATVTPLYRMTLAFDRHRLAEIDADIEGRRYQTDDPAWTLSKAMDAAKQKDPDVLRARTRIAGLLATPPEVFATPGLCDKVLAAGAEAPQYPTAGASRAELLATMAAAR